MRGRRDKTMLQQGGGHEEQSGERKRKLNKENRERSSRGAAANSFPPGVFPHMAVTAVL